MLDLDDEENEMFGSTGAYRMMFRTVLFVLFVVPAQATAAVLSDALITWDYTNTTGGVATSGTSLGFVPVDGTGSFSEGASQVSLQAATTTEPVLSVSGTTSGLGEGMTGSMRLVWEATVVDKSNPASTASVDLLVMGAYSLAINAAAGEFSGGGVAGTTGDALSSIAFAQASVNGLGLIYSAEIGTDWGCFLGGTLNCVVTDSDSSSFSGNLTIAAGTTIGLSMEVYADLGLLADSAGSVSAFADPYLAFADPNDALKYDIVWSSNLVTPVPLPSGGVLMLSGLGLLIAKARRAKNHRR